MTPSTRWSTDTKTHNLYTNMHTHTHTHVYKRIDVQIHRHMHIYTYIMSTHIHTYTHIHTRIQNVHMNARKARLKWLRGSDCAGNPTWHQEVLSFSLSVSWQRAIQTTSAYLNWCRVPVGHCPPKRGHFSAILAGFPYLFIYFIMYWIYASCIYLMYEILFIRFFIYFVVHLNLSNCIASHGVGVHTWAREKPVPAGT